MIKCKCLAFNITLSITVLPKWKQLGYTHIFNYLIKLFDNTDAIQKSFMVVANLIRSMAQFDPQFEVKLATHFTITATNNKSATTTQKLSLE